MGNIKIIRGVFDTKLELEHAGVAAGFPSPADDYRHETLDFNRDYIRHPEASFYGDVEGDSMKDIVFLDSHRKENIRRIEGDMLPQRHVSLYIREDYIQQGILNTITKTLLCFMPHEMIDERIVKYGIKL